MLADMLHRDELTGLYNRRFWTSAYPHYSKWAAENRQPMSLAVVDVDHFKTINDTLGHHQGDALLMQIAAILRGHPVGNIFPIRYGGDEFFILMLNVGRDQAMQYMSGIAHHVRNTTFKLEGTNPPKITLSVGVASFPEDVKDSTVLFEYADKAAYAAKRGGRDRVCSAQDATKMALDKDNLHRLLPAQKMVGRDDLLNACKALIGPWHGRNKPIQVLEGRQGVGRTRFIEELMRNAEPPRCQPVHCRCLPFLMHQPFGVLVETIQQISRKEPKLGEHMASVLDPFHKVEIGKLLPEWSRFSVLDAHKPSAATDSRIESLEDAFAHMLLAVTQKPYNRLLVMMIDDVQWLDPQSLSVLEKVKTMTEGKDVFLLMAERSDDPSTKANESLQEFLKKFEAVKGLERREIEPLTHPQLVEFLATVVPGIEQQPPLIYTIFQRSLGLPLLVEEIIKYLIQKDYIRLRDKNLEVAEVQEKDIPSNLADMLLLRTANLDHEIRDALNKAAVVGKVFEVESLRVLEQDKNEGYLLDILDRGKKFGLLREQDSGRFEFISQGAQDTFLNSLPDAEKRKYHEQVAAYDLGRSQGRDGNLNSTAVARMTYHYEAAGSAEKARAYLQSVTGAYAAALLPSLSNDVLKKLPKTQKEWGVETELGPEQIPLALRLVRTMKSSVQNFRAFPPHSEVVIDSQERLRTEVSELLNFTETLTFSYADGSLLINGKEMQAPRGQKKPSQEFAEFLGDSGLRGVSFKRGVTLDECKVFIEVMAMPPEEIPSKGGWAELFRKGKVKNIVVNEKIFVTMSERELIQSSAMAGGPVQVMAPAPVSAEAQAALSNLAQMTTAGGEAIDINALKEHLGTLMDVMKQMPVAPAGATPGGFAPDVSKQEVERLINLQGELTARYREMSRYLSNQIVDQVNLDLSVVVKDLESGHKFKIGAATDLLLQRGHEAVEQLIRLAMTTEDARARRLAIQIGRKIDTKILDRILEELYNTQNYDEKCRLLDCLNDFDDDRVVVQLATFLRFPDHKVRVEAINILESNPRIPAADVLMQALTDENEGVRCDVVWALGRSKQSLALEKLQHLVRKRTIFQVETDWAVQREACVAMGRIANPQAIERLIDTLKREPVWTMKRTKPSEVRAAAASALAFMPAVRVKDVLEKATLDKDSVVKGAAKVALDKLSGRRQGQDGEEVVRERPQTMRRLDAPTGSQKPAMRPRTQDLNR